MTSLNSTKTLHYQTHRKGMSLCKKSPPSYPNFSMHIPHILCSGVRHLSRLGENTKPTNTTHFRQVQTSMQVGYTPFSPPKQNKKKTVLGSGLGPIPFQTVQTNPTIYMKIYKQTLCLKPLIFIICAPTFFGCRLWDMDMKLRPYSATHHINPPATAITLPSVSCSLSPMEFLCLSLFVVNI